MSSKPKLSEHSRPSLFDEFQHIRRENVSCAWWMARHGYGWEDIVRWTDLGESDARRIVFRGGHD